MIIFPAIDIRGGKCVRLQQGDYNKETVYGDSPVEMAKQWQDKGAEYIHIVDLDGAKSGVSQNAQAIKDIAGELNVPIQVGGGIRSLEVIEQYISFGVARIIIGTAAISNQRFLREAMKKYPTQIAVSLDARNGLLATDGWTDTSTVRALDILSTLEDIGIETIVYTDIAKDGMLQGPNINELTKINQQTTMNVIASGGVTTKEDVLALKQLDLYGAIVGKALYDGKIEFEQIVGDLNER